MATEVFFLVEDADEGGYVARALGYSIFTEADTWDELKRAIRDAVLCHFDEGDQPGLQCLHRLRAADKGAPWSRADPEATRGFLRGGRGWGIPNQQQPRDGRTSSPEP
jgi:hypothetical protein